MNQMSVACRPSTMSGPRRQGSPALRGGPRPWPAPRPPVWRGARGRMLRINAAIVMPANAPLAKLEGTRTLGAEIILYDRDRESREAIASRLASERGATLVPAFDDPHIIAGQGTVGLELMEQARELDAIPDQ